MPELESTRRHADLIYDVGMHKGEDSDFYLKKGFRVIGFEADPDLMEHCRNRFSREIDQGRLTLVEGAIVEHTEQTTAESVRFYQNKNNSLFGTIQGDWARRNETLGASSNTIEVKTVDFANCLRQYGVPYYLKVDIEGSDAICLRALVNFEQKPDYVSIESEKVTFAKLLEEFHLFRKLGYTAFKAIQQEGISSQVASAERREGFYADYKFLEGASGLFGEDLPGKWKNYDEILAEYKIIFLLYNLLGDYSKLNSYFFSKAVMDALRRRHWPIPGWYDTHARHSTHIPKAEKRESGSDLKIVPSEHYTKHYYEIYRNGVSRSAEVIVPLVLQLLPVRSVVDVGCGDGSWLSIFRKLGVEDILGIDGDYVTRDFLQITQDHFQAIDLTKPFALGRVFDLAISLEVAEHLPAECSAAFIESLTRVAPFVLFSAAIPFQGGDCHINEQWQDKWVELFQRHSYVPIDFIRKRVWQNEAVYWWYSQNTLLYAHADLIESNPALKAEFERTNVDQLCLVHPRQYLSLHSLCQETLTRAQQLIPPPSGLKEASRIFMVCLKNAIRWRLDRIGQKEAAATAEPNRANRPSRGRL